MIMQWSSVTLGVTDENEAQCLPRDFTPDTERHGRICEAQSGAFGLICTRLAGHTGRHAAGNGSGQIVGVWA